MGDDWRKADTMGRLDIVHSTGPADRSFSVDVWGDGRAMQRHQWGNDPNRPIPDGETIKLLPGETLGGVVHDADGWPIQGRQVFLWSHNYKKQDPHELMFDLRAKTGPDGRWRTSGPPETTGELLGFYVVHPDYLSHARLRRQGFDPEDRRPARRQGRQRDEEGRAHRGPGGRRGRPAGRRRPGALGRGSGRPDSGPDKFAVTTDERGHFRTGQVGERRRGSCWRGRRAMRRARPRSGSTTPSRRSRSGLGRPHVFRGRVVDPSGQPVEGAFVNIDTWRRYRFLGVYLYTDADGRFRWDDVPDDEMMVNADCRGYRGVFQRKVKAADGGSLDFTLAPSLEIHGTVRDAETGKRVDAAAVAIGAIDPKTGEVASWLNPPELEYAVNQGYLDLNSPSTADAYKIRLMADGYRPSSPGSFAGMRRS